MKYKNISEVVVEYILTRNLDELSQLTRYKIANHLGIHQNYLSEKFKEGTDMTLSNFIDLEKMKRAETLLRTRYDLSVKSISEKIGIVKDKHFREKFRRFYCLNPGKYRSLYKVRN